MKSKFSRILGVVAVIALLASFLAVPVAADVGEATVDLDNDEISAVTEYTITFDVNDELAHGCVFSTGPSGSAELSDTQKHGGTYSAYLSDSGVGYTDDEDYGAGRVVIPDVNIAFAPITTLSYWFYYNDPVTEYPDAFPYMILALDTTVVEATLDGVADSWIVMATSDSYWSPTEDTWTQAGLAVGASNHWISFGDADNTTIGVAVDSALSVYQADDDLDTAAEAVVLDVKVAVGEWHHGTYEAITAYVDDIVIETTTYDLEEEGDAIIVEFPEDIEIDAITGVTVGASSGVGVPALPATPVAGRVDEQVLTIYVPDDEVGADIGAGARVQVVVSGVKNAPDTGDYTLDVSTSEEDDPVESEPFTLEVPDIDIPAGVVRLYNPSDILMDNYTGNDAIHQAIIDPKTAEDFVIKVGPGRYENDVDIDVADITIEAAGTAEETIIVGDVDLETEGFTLDGFTIDGSLDVLSTADENIIEDCIFEAETELDIAVGAEDIEVTDCSFTVEEGDLGLDMNEAAEITGCTFDVEDGGIAIDVGPVADGGEITDCTFNGVEDSGDGILLLGDTDVTDCTFDGLDTALDINGGTQVIDGNTIQDCADIAIDVDVAVEVLIHNNTITGCNDEVILDVADTFADNVFMLFNDITDNAGDEDLLINNDDAADLYVINNWWGDADGPEQGEDAFSGDEVIREPFLPGPATDGAIASATTAADFKDDCDVKVVGADKDMDIVAAARYPENPGGAIDDAIGFWDVFVIDIDEVNPVTELTIRFYTDVTEDTEVWVWGEAKGEWLECAAIPNLFAGFVGVVVSDDTTPTLDDLGELPFVVVEPPEETEDAVDITAPEIGAVDVSVTPTLAWGAIEDATYEIQIAQDATFAILDEAATSPTNAYIVTTALAEDQSYYWRVRAVTDAGAGKWATGVFTTATPEPEPEPPIEVVEVGPPEITVEIPQTVTQAIDPGLLWAIIGVGAVLVISLIVLIVRTRRTV